MSKKIVIIYSILLTIAAVGQFVLAIVLHNPDGNVLVINVGWGVLMLSGVFGWLPIFTFRRKGQVEGKGYINTTVLVDSGVYGIVRHPQYLAGILISIALTLISPHWLVAVFGLASIGIYYASTYGEEKNNVEKFGEAYLRYRENVPRLNFVLGIIRSFRQTKLP